MDRVRHQTDLMEQVVVGVVVPAHMYLHLALPAQAAQADRQAQHPVQLLGQILVVEPQVCSRALRKMVPA
jgi:hypothetical protein